MKRKSVNPESIKLTKCDSCNQLVDVRKIHDFGDEYNVFLSLCGKCSGHTYVARITVNLQNGSVVDHINIR